MSMTENTGEQPKYTNRLIHATSPYLLQHAHNPVDWYEWGEEAFRQAKIEDKPIHLSVGYTACHWCHVLASESFENPDTAALMNELFVNIKVDREERPDIDAIYMGAVQALTGGGGWPMTVFLTSEGLPFFGGTYFPPEDRYNMPAFTRVLRSVADAYQNRRGEVESAGQQLLERLQRTSISRPEAAPLEEGATFDEAFERLDSGFDETQGGFGGAPKFPQPMTLQFLLRYHLRRGDPKALHMVELTLHKMAFGGIYDQLGGGFHRYSVDARWLVPHFEKMLYDNAQLAQLYLEAYQVTGRALYRRVAEETLDYVAREMTHERGGFFSSQDADSLPYVLAGQIASESGHGHKEEGAFFVWTPDEVREVLGEDAQLFCQIYDVTSKGNFEGANILNLPRGLEDVARVTGVGVERIEEVRERGRRLLFAARGRRPWPERDDKVLAAWNGLMLRAFAEAARALGRDDYRQIAERNAAFLLDEMVGGGRLLRTWKDVPNAQGGRGQAKIQGYLEDYAMVADGLLALYQTSFDPRWLHEARQLVDQMLELFWDDEQEGFFDTARDAEALITRPREVTDNAVPAGTSVACEALLKLARLCDQPGYDQVARLVLSSLALPMAAYPTAFGRLLCAADWATAKVREVAIVGPADREDTRALLATVFGVFRPNQVVALLDPTAPSADEELLLLVPLLRDRSLVEGKATAYVCEHYACQLPVTTPEALEQQLVG